MVLRCGVYPLAIVVVSSAEIESSRKNHDLSVRQSVGLSECLSVCQSFRVFFRLSVLSSVVPIIRPNLCLSALLIVCHQYICPSVRLLVVRAVCLSVYLSNCVSVYLSVCPLANLPVSKWVCLSVCRQTVCLSVCRC